MIQNPARLTLERRQLRLENEAGEHTLPLEDITALILESPQITLTSALLSACQTQGIVVMTCDPTHTPNGLMLPFAHHSRQSKVAHLQFSWTDSLRDRIWKLVVQRKIKGQADCLALCRGEESAKRLYALIDRVEAGDRKNTEAQAAREYWQKLMGPDFRRGGLCILNAALNYGYAVMRAYVARAQVAYGLLPTFGLHHNSELNAFNLTDDLLELFRPYIDLEVFRMREKELFSDSNSDSLTREARQHLADIPNNQCRIDGQIHTLSNACEKVAAGLVSAIEKRSPPLMPLPDMDLPS